MKKLIFVAVVLVISVSVIFVIYTNMLEILKPKGATRVIKPPIKEEVFELAPDFTLKDLAGISTSLSAFKGKVVILDFWASWCPPCREEVPHFIELSNEYREEGFEIVAVALDARGLAAVKPFSEERGINYTVLIGNSAVTDLYGGIFTIPTSYLIDREGRIRKKYIGYKDKEVFETDIKELI